MATTSSGSTGTPGTPGATAPSGSPQFVRFGTAYQGNDPATIYAVDPSSKTLDPISSGDTYTGAGYQYGSEALVDPSGYSDYKVGSPVNSVDQLNTIKTNLNDYQASLMPDDSNSRQASQVQSEIDSAEKDYETEKAQFDSERAGYAANDPASLTDYYNSLAQSQGLNDTENQLAGVKSAEGSLEGDMRGNTGNSPETESEFQSTLAQKQLPLIQKETALNQRLSAAKDYINNAVSLKKSDSDASQAALEKGIALTEDALNATSTRINNLTSTYSAIQGKVAQGQSTAQATVNTLVSSGALSQMSDQDLALLEAQAGMPPGSLKAIASTVKPKSNVIDTTTDDNGNVAVITQNPDGSFSAHVIPGVKGKSTPPPQPTQKDDSSKIAQSLELLKGRDGYVSPQDYKNALSAWVQAGYDANSFHSNFSNYVNPADAQDYDINYKAPTTAKSKFLGIF